MFRYKIGIVKNLSFYTTTKTPRLQKHLLFSQKIAKVKNSLQKKILQNQILEKVKSMQYLYRCSLKYPNNQGAFIFYIILILYNVVQS